MLRYALPGTLRLPGVKPSPPRGAGTGFVYLRRWSGGSLAEKTAARLTHPRSTSFAARDWNLYCHLREHGVGTAQPMAMGEEAAPLFAARSFLVTRALANMLSLPDHLREHPGAEQRRHLAQALGLFLARIAEARVRLPRLELADVFVAQGRGAASCSANEAPPVPGLARRALPELALASVTGGRILERWSLEETAAVLQCLASQVEEGWRLGPRLFYRVLRHAAGPDATREERKRAWRRLSDPEPAR